LAWLVAALVVLAAATPARGQGIPTNTITYSTQVWNQNSTTGRAAFVKNIGQAEHQFLVCIHDATGPSSSIRVDVSFDSSFWTAGTANYTVSGANPCRIIEMAGYFPYVALNLISYGGHTLDAWYSAAGSAINRQNNVAIDQNSVAQLMPMLSVAQSSEGAVAIAVSAISPMNGAGPSFSMGGGQMELTAAAQGYANSNIPAPMEVVPLLGAQFNNASSPGAATWEHPIACPNTAVINVTGGTTATIISSASLGGSTITNIRICGYVLSGSANTTAVFKSEPDTTASCGGTPTAMTGTIQLAANIPFVDRSASSAVLRAASAAGTGVQTCITAGAGAAVTGYVNYQVSN
jgi:hypothetical protein